MSNNKEENTNDESKNQPRQGKVRDIVSKLTMSSTSANSDSETSRKTNDAGKSHSHPDNVLESDENTSSSQKGIMVVKETNSFVQKNEISSGSSVITLDIKMNSPATIVCIETLSQKRENLLDFSSDSDVVYESDEDDKSKIGAVGGRLKKKKPINIKDVLHMLSLKPEEFKKSENTLTAVEIDDSLFKNVAAYVKKSHGLGKNVTAKVLNLYEYERKNLRRSNSSKGKSSLNSDKSSLNSDKSSLNSDKSSHNYRETSKTRLRMLLWYKCTSSALGQILLHGLQLRQHVNSLVFYDRFFKVVNKAQPDNGLYCLCEVFLGKMHKSPHGAQTWNRRQLPLGYDSVKATGEIKPNWENNEDYNDGTIIPCGEDQKNLQFSHYTVQHNEYIIFNPKQVKVAMIANVTFER